MPAAPFENLRRILFIRLDNIGDVIMTSPALRALRQAYPQADITFMASPGGSQAAALLPWIDTVFPWRASWQDISPNPAPDPEKEHALVELLHARQFDAAFISTSFSQSPYPPAYACYLAQIPVRVGQSREFGGALLTHWVKPLPDSAHQVERSLHLLRSCGIPAEDSQMELRVPGQARERAEQILDRAGIGPGAAFLTLAPGASAETRRYPEIRFAQAARLLADQTGLPLVILGSQRKSGRFPVLEELAASDPRIHSLVGQTTVPEMAAVIQRCAVLIANNSGTMHIAAGTSRPMVILFSGSELPEQWAPQSPRVRLLNQETPCTPCHRFQCPYHLECLEVPPEKVARAVLQLLAEHPEMNGDRDAPFKPSKIKGGITHLEELERR